MSEPRRWTLVDGSDDYNPEWAIGDGTPPPALEHLEEVVVMPVSEHEQALIDALTHLATMTTAAHEAALEAARQVDEPLDFAEFARAALLAALSESEASDE